MHSELKKVITFGAIGSLNTTIGLLLIYFFRLTTESEVLANISAYGVGFLMSYFLNGIITFSSNVKSLKIFAKFLLAFLFSWLGNVLVVIFFLNQKFEAELSHLMGMPVFTMIFYLLSRFYVFAGQDKLYPYGKSLE